MQTAIFSHYSPTDATFAVAHLAVVSDAVTEVDTFGAVIVELATVEFELPVAEASDEVAATTIAIALLLIRAFDGGMFSSIFIFVSAICDLVQGISDGTGELFAATHAAALKEHLIQVDGAFLSEWYMSVQHAGLQALVDFLRIFAGIFEKLVHPPHLQGIFSLTTPALLLMGSWVNEAGY